MITFEFRGIDQWVNRLRKVSKEIERGLRTAMTKVGILVADHVKSQKLTNQVLHVRTGHLRRNVKSAVRVVGSDVFAVVGVSDIVPYGRIHELGGQSGPGHATTIPARPYLAPSPKEKEREIVMIVGDQVRHDIRVP